MNYPKPITIIALMTVTLAIGFIAGFHTHTSSSKKVVSGPAQGSAAAYYHSTEECQAWSGAKVDGIWGEETSRLYNAKRDRVYNNRMAMELWPEMVE